MTERQTNSHFETMPYRPAEHGAVLTQQEFMTDFGHEARSGSEVFTAVMALEAGEVGDQVVGIMANAHPEAEKTVVYDAFSHMVSQGMILKPYEYVPSRRNEVRAYRERHAQLVDALHATGTEVIVTNPPTSFLEEVFPFTGRSHLKVSYVERPDESDVAYIHSHNYQSAHSTEVTVKFTGERARGIIDLYNQVIEDNPTEDFSLDIAGDMTIYVDSGEKNKSIILEKAIELVSEAEKSIYISTQLPLGGAMAEQLHNAHATGKHVEGLISKRSADGTLYTDNNVMALVSLMTHASTKLQGLEYPTYQDPLRNMHAKLLLTDVYSDHPQAFFGSHNFATSGVRAGTREIQVLSKDPAIVHALHRQFVDFKLGTQPDLQVGK